LALSKSHAPAAVICRLQLMNPQGLPEAGWHESSLAVSGAAGNAVSPDAKQRSILDMDIMILGALSVGCVVFGVALAEDRIANTPTLSDARKQAKIPVHPSNIAKISSVKR